MYQFELVGGGTEKELNNDPKNKDLDRIAFGRGEWQTFAESGNVEILKLN